MIGKWRGDKATRGPVIELRADGSMDKEPTLDLRCERDQDAVIAACRARQTWDRDGDRVTLRMAVVSQTAAYSTAQQLMGPLPEERCECHLDPIEAKYANDALVVGKERAVRVR